MRQNIIFSTLAVAVAPAAAMAAPGIYMSEKGVAIAVTDDPKQPAFESSPVQLPQKNDDDGLRAFYLKYDFAHSSLPTGTKVRIYYGDILLSERDASAESSVWPITPKTFVVPDDFPESATLKLTVQLPDGEKTGSISDIRLTAEKKYVNKHILSGFYTKVQQYATTIQTAGYTLSNDDNADLLLMQDLSVEGKEEKTVENYQKFDIFNGTGTIETAFKELQAKIEKAEIDKAVAAAEQAIGDIDAAEQKLGKIVDPDNNYSNEAKLIAEKILKDIEESKTKKQDLKEAEDGMKEYNAEKLADLQKKANDLKALDAYIAWQLKASDTQIAIDQYKALLDELDATVNTDVVLDKDGKFTEGGAGLGAYQLLAFRNWMGRLKGKQAALDAFIAKGAENYKAYEDGNATEFAVPENVKGGDWLKNGEGNYIKSFTDPIYDGYAWLNGTDAYVATLKANKYTDEQINNTINGLKTSVFGETKAFAKIEDLLGTEKTPEIGSDGIPKHIKDGSVLGNIAYVKGCAMLYTQKSAQVYDEVIAAEKDYNERMTLLGAEFQKYKYTVGGEEKVVFEDALPTVREFLYQLIMKDTRPGHEGTPGVLTIKDELTAVKKAGGDISYITGYENKGFGKQPNPDFTKDGDYVPWQEWENLLLKTLTKDADSYAVKYVTGWANYAKSAYERYTDLKALVTGTTDKDHQLQAMLNAMLPGEGDPALDATVKANLDDIQKLINELSTKLDEAVNKIEDVDVSGDKNHLDNFLINNQDFDKTAASGKWNDAGYGEGSADEYHSYANIMAKLQKMSKAIEELGKIDLLAKRLKDASDALNAMTPATSDDPSATLYTGRFAYKATDFYGFKDIDDPTTTADEAAANEGWAKVITDWLKAARAKLIGDPTLDYTQPSFADGDDNFSDGNGGFVKYDDINNDITALVTGGNGFDGVTNWKALLDLVKADSVRIDEIESQVKDHGIYTDPTYDYKTLIENWRQEIANFFELYNWYASTYPNTDEAHWLDLKNASYTPLTLADDAQIATDKAAKELAVLKQQVDDLYAYLYGDNGYDETGSTPGYIDTVLGKYAQVKAAYEGKIKDKNAADVFGSKANSADRGNAETLAAIMDSTNGVIKIIKETTGGKAKGDQSQAIKDYENLGTTPTKAQLDVVYDKLLKLRDQLDVFYKTMEEGEKINDITATEGKPNAMLDGMETMPTNLGLLQQLITKLADNKAAYDGILNVKGRLEQKAENVKKALTDEYEETDQSKVLLDIVEHYFMPMTTAENTKILKLYKDMKAVSEGPESTRKADEESKYEVYVNGDVNYMTKENKEQVVYWKFYDALTELTDLFGAFDTGYPDYLAAKNANSFNNVVKGEYDKAMTKYKEIVFNLKEFKIPNDEYLKQKYEQAFKTATEKIYQAPELLLKAKALADANMAAANKAKETYEPVDKKYVKVEDEAIYNKYDGVSPLQYSDQGRIGIIQKACENYFAQFTEAMQNAVKERWAQLRTTTNDAINDAQEVIKNYYATPKPVLFKDYYATDGTKYVDEDTKYDYLYESKGVFKEADDLHNKITALDWKTYGDFGEFDTRISGEILDVEGNDVMNNVFTGINKHLNVKKNEAANTDLTNRIEIARINKVNPNTKALKGDPEQKDGNGNAIDLKKEYKTKYFGFGPEPDIDGYYYSYKRALGETAYNLLCAEFDELVDETVNDAEELKNSYYEAVQLPLYYDEELATDVNSRQKVIDRIDAYTDVKFNAILNKFLNGFDYTDPETDLTTHYEGYKDFIARADYHAAMRNFRDRFATEKAGIESLYAGTDPAITNKLKVMEDQFKQEEEKEGSVDIFSLTDQLDDLIASDEGVKKMDYDAMIKELTTLKNEYNQMVANYNKAIDAETDADKKEELKAERDALIAKFDTAGDALNIDENIAKLEDYEKRRSLYTNTTSDKDNNHLSSQELSMEDDATYEDYVAVEHNVGLIKTEIAKIDKTQTDETIAQMGQDLLDALQDLQDKVSAYINQASGFSVDQLLTAPVNPKDEADTYKFDDFGLYQFYLPAEFKGVEFKGSYLKDAIGKVAESVQKHIDAKDILLFAANLQKQINEFNAGGNVDIDDIDLKTNSNIDDAVTSAYERNLQKVKFAEVQKAQLERLQAEYDAVAAKVQPAKDAIAGLGEFQGDFSKVNEELAKIQRRITVYYLADKQILETVTMTKDKGAAIYKIKKFVQNSAEVTDEWIASKGLTDVYNKKTGEVSLPGNIGLTAIEALIAEEVQKFVTQVADAKYAEALDAYTAALDKLNDTQMRYEDKEALRGKLYGATIANTNDGGFQEQLQGTGGLEARKATQTIETIDKYVADVDAFVKALLGTDDEAGFVDEVAGKTAGDLDGNGIINVIDLTDLLKYVTDPKQQNDLDKEMFAARDLNNDGYIDVVDLGIMVDIITGQTDYLKAQGVFAARALHNSNETLRADVAATNGNTQRIAISLNNERDYTTFQMDITLPEGMRLVGQSLSDRANGQQLYANEWDGKTRLVGFTMSKAAFTGNDGDVLYLDVETDESYKGGSIRFEDIIFVTTESEGVRFSMKGEATSIADRIADTAKETIYNLGGRMMNSLKKGVNILRGNNGAKKVIKK